MNRRVVFVAPDKGFDSWRMHWPAQGLMQAGEDVVVLGFGSRTTDVDLGPDDIVVIHVTNQATRDIDMSGTVYGADRLVEYCQARTSLGGGAKVVLNFDDDYTAHSDIQDVSHSGWYTPFIEDIASACRRANLVVVATPQLEDVYGRWSRRITTVRNYPPETLWASEPELNRPYDVCFMGYIGTQEAPLPHRRDLGPVLPYLMDLDLYTIGDISNVRALVAKAPEPERYRLDGTGALSQEVPVGVKTVPLYKEMSKAKAGICPLAEHNFNRSKSWIKALEFAMCGTVPVVGSWHPAYKELQTWVPMMVYDGPSDIRRAIDEVLGASETDRLLLSLDLREHARQLTMERAGVAEWQRALTMLD